MTAWSGSSPLRKHSLGRKCPRRGGTWCLRDATLSLSLPRSWREEAAGVTALLEAGQTLEVRQLPPRPKLRHGHGELDELPGDP